MRTHFQVDLNSAIFDTVCTQASFQVPDIYLESVVWNADGSWCEGRRTAACQVRRLMQSKDDLWTHLLQVRAGQNPGNLMRRWWGVSDGEISDAVRRRSSRFPPSRFGVVQRRFMGALPFILWLTTRTIRRRGCFHARTGAGLAPALFVFLWNVQVVHFCSFNTCQWFLTVSTKVFRTDKFTLCVRDKKNRDNGEGKAVYSC